MNEGALKYRIKRRISEKATELTAWKTRKAFNNISDRYWENLWTFKQNRRYL